MSIQPLHYWYLKLRWFAFLGQILLLYFAVNFLELTLNYEIITALLIFIPLTNWLTNLKIISRISERNLLGILLTIDTIILTSVLYFSGGPSNPFTIVYFLHVVLAAILLNNLWLWFITTLSSLAFALLFFASHQIPELEHHGHHSGLSLHLYGMLVAFVLVAFLGAYFLSKITRELNSKERRLQRLKNIANNQQRLTTLATLTANAAHELNTPLGTISLVVHELERKYDHVNPQDLKDDLILLKDEVQRCKNIMLNLSEKTGERLGESLQNVNLKALVNTIVESISHGNIKLNIPEDCAVASIPVKAFSLALKAVIKNAVEASKDSTPVYISYKEDSNYQIIEIVDQGNGMTKEELEQIGEPFYSTKGENGMGLGVYLARLTIEQLGGNISINSTLGKGTKIRILIPNNSYKNVA